MKDRAAVSPLPPRDADARPAGAPPSESTMSHPHASAAQPLLDERLVAELPALRAYVGRLAHAAEVDDLLQEALARALRYRASFEAGRALGPWLRGVALRVVLDRRSQSARRPEALTDDTPDRAACPTARADDRDELSRTLSVLSDVERAVLVRFHARSESVHEIASALALPEGTVKSHLHRARRKLAAGGTP